jgi:type VI secretion system protein ImpK
MSDSESNNPFAAFESDRTVIKPSAGRARGAGSSTPPTPSSSTAGGLYAPAQLDASGIALLVTELPPFSSLNPLVQLAGPLLGVAPRLRATLRHPNPAALRAALVEAIQRFESAARAHSLPNEQIVAARYVLCTFLDEAASNTPWGGAGSWASQSLLVQFHSEAWGGEKVFQLLTRLAQQPEQQRHLLEFIWVVLTLGFEGRYKVQADGRQQLDLVRERLSQMLRRPAEPELSPDWQGERVSHDRLRDGVPIWVLGAGALLLLALLFFMLRISLSAQTDATFNALQTLDATAPVQPAPPPPTVSPSPRLAQLLASDIAAGAVQVKDLSDRSVVTVNGDTLFEPGSAEVAARARSLFEHIAQALAQLPGPVVVTGHTDNQSIRSLRFPSNWHLSKERANAVQRLLLMTLPAERVRAEGRADAEPVADNASAEGRAKNRRVELTLTVTAAP